MGDAVMACQLPVKVGDKVRVIPGSWKKYDGRVGAIVEAGARDRQAYYAVQFEGVDHVAWFFGHQLKGLD